MSEETSHSPTSLPVQTVESSFGNIRAGRENSKQTYQAAWVTTHGLLGVSHERKEKQTWPSCLNLEIGVEGKPCFKAKKGSWRSTGKRDNLPADEFQGHLSPG